MTDQPDTADPKRVVLLKPGDTLLIGNLGSVSDEDFGRLVEAIEPLRVALNLDGVVFFENDIDIDAYQADLESARVDEEATRRASL